MCSRGCVDGSGGTACGVGVVEVGQDVPGSVFECSSQCDEFGQALGTRVEVSVLISASIRALPLILLGSR